MQNAAHTPRPDRREEPWHRWGVVLAGGDGERLLPLTRRITGDDRPKQFCCILGDQTLLVQTRCRVARIIPPQQIVFVLTRTHERYYIDQVDRFGRSCLIIQPHNRGTAPAILYSLMSVQRVDPRGVVAFFPSDHYFSQDAALDACVNSAFAEAQSHPDTVILLGIQPEAAEVDYGWIQPGARLPNSLTGAIFRVRRFWEKPSHPVAASLLSLGCLWNSFIMVGRVQAFLNLTKQGLPTLFQLFRRLTFRRAAADEESLSVLYSRIPTTNYSQAVLSTCPSALAVLRAENLGWSDLGEPARVLSLVARKQIRTSWSFEAIVHNTMVRTAST